MVGPLCTQPALRPVEGQDIAAIRLAARDLASTGHHEQAVGLFRRVLEIEHDDTVSLRHLVRSLRYTGSAPEAIEALRRLAALEPG